MYHSHFAAFCGHYTLGLGIDKDEDIMVFTKKKQK